MPTESGAGSTLRATGITENDILRTDYAMITIVSVFIVARLAFQVTRRKKPELQDYFIYLAYAFYLALCALYLTVTPILFNIQDITTGVIPMPADFMQTAGMTSRLIWSAQMCFYSCLWSVKFSLLCLYRKLLLGLPTAYARVWWALVILCFLAFLGCVTSTATSCKNLSAFFKTSECYAPEEVQAQTISLFLAFALDVFTDILVMALPIHLIWNLQMPRLQKAAVCLLFGTGLVCIAFAAIRVVQVGINDKGQASTPEPKWLTLWTVLETSMVVIVGCCPAFAALIRTRRNTKRESSHGYVKQSGGSLGVGSDYELRLKTMVDSKSNTIESETMYSHSHSSQEQLASSSRGITVTTDLSNAKR